jgi:hypothetical protein
MEWRPGRNFPAALLQRRRMARRDLRLLAVEERQPGRTEVVVPGREERFQRRSGERFQRFPSSLEAWKIRSAPALSSRLWTSRDFHVL